jgi:hypothetical protein
MTGDGPELEVLAIGAAVHIGPAAGTHPDPIAAMVTAVTIRAAGQVVYEVVWWDGRSRHCEWVQPCEITTDGPARMMTIGFAGWHERARRPDVDLGPRQPNGSC